MYNFIRGVYIWQDGIDLGADMDMAMVGEGGTDMVTVTVSETYDLSTKPNKMSLIGVHTPPISFIRKMYPGFFMNYKMMKIEKCDLSMACASILPADPLQIGTEAGSIAPSDMMNPIMYKAVSNESMSTLEARLLALYSADTSINGQSVIVSRENVTSLEDEFPVYYGLLSNRDGWRLAVPQQGLSMSNLVPLCFEQLYDYGINGPDTGGHSIVGVGQQGQFTSHSVRSIRGNSKPLPAFNTTSFSNRGTGNPMVPVAAQPGFVAEDIKDGSPGTVPQVAQTMVPYVPPFYVACLVMPPSKLQTLYYRLVVRWTVSFYGPRQISEITNLIAGLSSAGTNTFFTDYQFGNAVNSVASKELSDEAMVSVADANIQKIMEGS